MGMSPRCLIECSGKRRAPSESGLTQVNLLRSRTDTVLGRPSLGWRRYFDKPTKGVGCWDMIQRQPDTSISAHQSVRQYWRQCQCVRL
jgi:hypothetical protein